MRATPILVKWKNGPVISYKKDSYKENGEASRAQSDLGKMIFSEFSFTIESRLVVGYKGFSF